MMRAKVPPAGEKLAKVLDRCKMFHVERRNRMWIFFQSASIVLRGSERVGGKAGIAVPLGCSTWNVAIGCRYSYIDLRCLWGEMLVGDGYLTDMFHVEQLLVEF